MNYVVDGRQHCESTGTTNKRLALKILDKRKGEITEGRFRLVPAQSPHLKDWSDEYLETIRHPGTKRVYKSCVETLKEFFGEIRLSQITVSRIEEFKTVRQKAGAGPAIIN